jgi:hypothetical protein
VDAVATEELWIFGEASPALGDNGRAQEICRLWREAEQDLVEEVIVFQRMRPYRRRRGGPAAAVAHFAPRSIGLGSGVEGGFGVSLSLSARGKGHSLLCFVERTRTSTVWFVLSFFERALVFV